MRRNPTAKEERASATTNVMTDSIVCLFGKCLNVCIVIVEIGTYRNLRPANRKKNGFCIAGSVGSLEIYCLSYLTSVQVQIALFLEE